jgi:hypothetical protein
MQNQRMFGVVRNNIYVANDEYLLFVFVLDGHRLKMPEN